MRNILTMATLMVAICLAPAAAWAGKKGGGGPKGPPPGPLNACGCYQDSQGGCFCPKGKCGCPGECEPKGCEEKRQKEQEKIVKEEMKKAADAEKKQREAEAKAEASEAAGEKTEKKDDKKPAKAEGEKDKPAIEKKKTKPGSEPRGAGSVIAPILALAAASAVSKPAPLPAIPLPKDPTAAVARESEVVFEAGEIELYGTLALPPEGKAPFPTVLLIPGGPAEPYDRDNAYYGIKFFRQIAHRLAAHGVASLRYDKRGIGKSKGELGSSTIATLASDARAGLAFLRSRPEVAARGIGVLGHAEGATILLEAVGSPSSPERSIAGVVLLASTSLRGDEALAESMRLGLETRGANEEQAAKELDRHRQIVEAARTGQGLGKFSPAIIAQAEAPFFKSLIDFDPKLRLAKLRAPVLIIHGQKDRQISANHAPALKAILAKSGNRRVEVIVDPYINHLLAVCETGSPAEYGALGSKADPESIERIALWAKKTLRR